ncbi:cyclic GMP-AMP synthase-like receptor 1 isoform X2 [Acropora muricata]|uniref:cyclic GMP-AMP synthase-like receptor 1 isoform X2 n=1 Tax=Acropora muricata TaxID=159855 RepID=UPI0034E4A90F
MSELNDILNRFTNEKVSLRNSKSEKRKALDFWEPKVRDILENVKQKDPRFAGMEMQFKGSYYERCKVGEPDEFDLMLVMKNLELNGDPYDDPEDDRMSEPPTGFTRVMIDMGEEETWKKNRCVDVRGMLSASRVKSVFASLVEGAIEECGYTRFVKKSSHGPAVTLLLTNDDGKSYSIDLAPAIKDKTWPEDADEWKARSRRGTRKRFCCFNWGRVQDRGHSFPKYGVMDLRPVGPRRILYAKFGKMDVTL